MDIIAVPVLPGVAQVVQVTRVAIAAAFPTRAVETAPEEVLEPPVTKLAVTADIPVESAGLEPTTVDVATTAVTVVQAAVLIAMVAAVQAAVAVVTMATAVVGGRTIPTLVVVVVEEEEELIAEETVVEAVVVVQDGQVGQAAAAAMVIGVPAVAAAVVDRHTVSMAAAMTDGILVPLRL